VWLLNTKHLVVEFKGYFPTAYAINLGAFELILAIYSSLTIALATFE